MPIITHPEVERFIYTLEKSSISKALKIIDLLELFGNQLGMPHPKKITSNIFELRVRGRQEIRIFYSFQDNKAILLHGFIKKSNKTPASEIKTATNHLTMI